MYEYNGILSLRKAVSKEPKYRERLMIIYLSQITFGAKKYVLGTEYI